MTHATSVPMPTGAYWRRPAILFAAASGLAFIALGLRAIIVPATSSSGFGLPMTSASEILWVQVYGSRTMLLGVIALVLLLLRNVRALAWMLAIGALVPFFDMGLIISHAGPGPILFRHAAYVAWLGLAALLLWRLARQSAQAA
jgi:hypothetical protein